MRLSEIVRSGFIYDELDVETNIIIGNLSFNLKDRDPEVEIVYLNDEQYTYKIDGRVYDFHSGMWSQ